MMYYKALDDRYDYFTGNALVKNELITPRERNTKYRYISDRFFSVVNVKKTETYFNFGVRLQAGQH